MSQKRRRGPRKSQVANPKDNPPDILEFEGDGMVPIRCLQIKHDETRAVVIQVRRQDDVELYSKDREENKWLGHVVSIRCRRNELDDLDRRAWLRIRWYYSGYDVVGKSKDLLPVAARFATNERVLTDDYEIIEFNMIKEADFYSGARCIRLLAVDPDHVKPHPDFSKYIYPRLEGGKMAGSWEPLIRDIVFGSSGKPGLGEGIVKMAMQPILRAPNPEKGSVFPVVGNLKDVVLARRLVFQYLEGGHGVLRHLWAKLGISDPKDEYRDQAALSPHTGDPGALGNGKQPELKKEELVMSPQSDASGSTTADTEARYFERYKAEDILNYTRLLASPYMPYWNKQKEILAAGDFLSSAPAVRCPNCGSAI
ncbi:hypothetical protein EIP91_003369 [Steccherinum ochraceum]|uniref:BAH domain-containing protein n=1 Tax=Steccherinum ochraceum TaxID=92696 RepID=A0A4R0RAQ5_9APHY|nr:hypothetical protein EIP91_003369 [Steccherinum ochraceum]